MGRESSPPWAEFVAEVRPVAPLRIPVRLEGIEFIVAVVCSLIVADLIEDEVLQFGAEIGSVADPRAGQVGLGFVSDMARIAPVVDH